jgi:hypothetical protein
MQRAGIGGHHRAWLELLKSEAGGADRFTHGDSGFCCDVGILRRIYTIKRRLWDLAQLF